MKTIESNKLIAEFMNWEENEHHWSIDGDKGLMYHNSWDWLMPVVRKIVELCCDQVNDHLFQSDQYTSILDTISIAIIDDAYKVVIEFITFYNINK